MNIDVRLKGEAKLLKQLDGLIDELNKATMDALEEGGEYLADEFASADRRDLAKDSWTVERRDKDDAVAVGPSKAGHRGHIVRFHEWGTRFLSARPMMRPATESAEKDVLRVVARALRKRLR